MLINQKMFYIFFLLLTFLTIQSVLAQNKLSANVISSGVERSSNTSFILSSTAGESFTGKSVNATNQNNLGFWYIYKQNTITDVGKEETIPNVFKLEQNYPNPFNPSTIIKFGVPEKSMVLLKVYDILGREVATLLNGELDAGWYSREFNATNYSSGIYIYRMQAGAYVSTRKMMLIK